MAAKPRPRPAASRKPDPRVRQNVPVEKVANKVAVSTAPGIEFLGRGRVLAAAEPVRRGGGSAAVVVPAP